MKTTWRPLMVGDAKLAIRITLCAINWVEIKVSIPCRNGQYIILDCGNDSYSLSYSRGKCIITWLYNTSQIHSAYDLLYDISTWFKYHYAIRLNDPENPYTIKELYNSL